MIAATILTLSVLVLVSFMAIGVIVGYLVRQYFEENKPIYTSHPELWDPETGRLIVDSDILAIRVENESGLPLGMEDEDSEE
jgi:hypothetical protein